MKSLIVLFFLIALNTVAVGQVSFKTIAIDLDTIKSTQILKRINNDSIAVLEYQKIRYDDMPGVTDERVVYIDYRKSFIQEEINKAKRQLESILNGKSIQKVYKVGTKVSERVTEKEITKTYIPIHKLNGHYFAFLSDLEHPRIISDTAFFYKDDEGLIQYSIQDFFRGNNSYTIVLQDFNGKISRKEIRYYDSNKCI